MEYLPNLYGFRSQDAQFILQAIQNELGCYWCELDDCFVIHYDRDHKESPFVEYPFNVSIYAGPLYHLRIFLPLTTLECKMERDSENLWGDCIALVKETIDKYNERGIDRYLRDQGLI